MRKFVLIDLNDSTTKSQVKVFSDPSVEDTADRLVNLAFEKPTSQSSTAWGGVPERAVDGREAGKWSS